jgi:magnesium chelatase family protein
MITVRSAVLVGIESLPVTITAEASMSPGGIVITGLSAPAMRETRVRVRSALVQCGIETGNVDVTVTPEVSSYPGSLDLAIALAIAELRGGTGILRDVVYIGELALDGRLHAVRGAVAHARAAGKGAVGKAEIVVPAGNCVDASATSAQVLSCESLADAAINGNLRLVKSGIQEEVSDLDIADIVSPAVRRALEISAAGRHPLLLVGGPGTGKTAAARRLAGILPSLTADEALDVLTIHDAAGLRGGGWGQALKGAPVSRPFRAPHHTVSELGLLGGGDHPRPGEVTLGHHGVLFLDEAQEFRKSTIEALRGVLAEGKITLRRHVTLPGVPLLIGATNKCECGPSYITGCKCSPEQLKRFRERAASYESLFAMRVEVPDYRIAAVSSGRMSSDNSASVRARVEAARKILPQSPDGPFVLGRSIPTITPEAQRLLDTKALQLPGIRDVCRVAKTIAALDDEDMITEAHMSEALTFRVKP